tara:strand:+ start:340 stop:537 length:198 start_codon:yes stop_codon:yes gene_type:complete
VLSRNRLTSYFEILRYDFLELYICGFSFYTTKYRYSPKGMEYFSIPKKININIIIDKLDMILDRK